MSPAQEAAFLQSVGGKMTAQSGGIGGGAVWDFGWIPPTQRTQTQLAMDDAIKANAPTFGIKGSWKDQERVALWKAGVKLLGRHLPYNWQLTGSCVGAGGGNMLKTLMAVEIVVALQAEEYKEVWWPYPYGKSRERAGMRSPGEGSLGSTWAQAITQDGSFSIEEVSGLPAFREVQGWLQLDERTELKWSDGDAASSDAVNAGKKHLVKTFSQCRNHADVLAAITNGYPCTQASSFGFRPMVPSPQGSPPVRLVTWNGSWNHQTYIDEVWNHPTLGLIFRWGNNWGPDAHGPALADEPPSSVYISAKTMDEICRQDEVFAFSAYEGFPAREVKLDWTP